MLRTACTLPVLCYTTANGRQRGHDDGGSWRAGEGVEDDDVGESLFAPSRLT